MLVVNNLHVSVDNQPVLRGVDLHIGAGEVHAIMGPNGSGKSTLAAVLSGKQGYVVTQGSIEWLGNDLLSMSPEDRAAAGLFLAFQYPVEIPGVNNLYFLKMALNCLRKQQGRSELDVMDFMALVKGKLVQVGLTEDFLKRSVNVGFSGGEKKRNEILQLLLLEPLLAILDETDSGLDIDSLQTVAHGINHLRNEQRSMILVTHYQRLLNYITPDFVHVLKDGQIIQSGNADLALKLEKQGYTGIHSERERVTK